MRNQDASPGTLDSRTGSCRTLRTRLRPTVEFRVSIHHFSTLSCVVRQDVLDQVFHHRDFSNFRQFSKFGNRHEVWAKLHLRDASTHSPDLARLSWFTWLVCRFLRRLMVPS